MSTPNLEAYLEDAKQYRLNTLIDTFVCEGYVYDDVAADWFCLELALNPYATSIFILQYLEIQGKVIARPLRPPSVTNVASNTNFGLPRPGSNPSKNSVQHPFFHPGMVGSLPPVATPSSSTAGTASIFGTTLFNTGGGSVGVSTGTNGGAVPQLYGGFPASMDAAVAAVEKHYKKCECGSDKVSSLIHSSWCQMYTDSK